MNNKKMQKEIYRTHQCGVLNIGNLEEEVRLCGWVQKSRDLGGMTFIDLRDRSGIVQLTFNMEQEADLCNKARKLGREYVIQIDGKVTERSNKNKNIPTGEIEIFVEKLEILSASKTPPFTIEEETDGGEELRMKYRYLDLRRNKIKEKIILRSKVAQSVRNYLSKEEFLEIETPFLIKSTPEGARDFVVPSRMHKGEFYALPQSPQTFKQLLMIGGFDKYFQIVKCFRDEDLRADRQPEFTQIDCEMSFVNQADVMKTFEGMTSHIFKEIRNIDLGDFPQISYQNAMEKYGSDKPDTRFELTFNYIDELVKGKGFNVFDKAKTVIAITVPNAANYSRKQLDKLTKWVKRPQVGAEGLIYVKCNEDGSYKSSVDKFYNQEELAKWAAQCKAGKSDLLLVLSGDKITTQTQMSALRLKMGEDLELYNKADFNALWVVDFPLLEWDEEAKRYHAMHHPFTAPKKEDVELLNEHPEEVRANAYDLVINGVEIGGGSLRIHQKELQQKMFKALGFSKEKAESQFGFLMKAFEYGTPPHGGIAFGFDRLCAILGGSTSIRDYIAFPKNNAGRDLMIESPSKIDETQLDELGLNVKEE